mgnify:FL=1
MKTTVISSPLGFIKIEGNNDGIFSLNFTQSALQSDLIPNELQEVVVQLQEYFSGTRKEFTIKIAPRGTEFQQKVWNLLQQIPHGKSISYSQLSEQYGDPKAIRSVASANGKNPILIIIPCHRVISKDGGLGGFSAEIWRKEWLLNHEQNILQEQLF